MGQEFVSSLYDRTATDRLYVGENRTQEYGGKTYTVPDIVNYTSDTNSDYRSSYGKTVTEYSESLSVHAGMEADFPGFSASASTDYSDSQRETLSNSFTRITYLVTQYNLSLPPVAVVQQYLKSWFVNDLENRDPIDFTASTGLTYFARSPLVVALCFSRPPTLETTAPRCRLKLLLVLQPHTWSPPGL